eukprot:TRINITY_DN6263_c1_g1_i1.p1 TRINITY_DN6263_c1_g1~~TRINITY_DN6263_c1_g1_i1.p1  ORF type:complete len:281 (+),score=47.84 TRINITY_DN6263_c1_g1_i1:37-879(+)
MGAEDQNNNEDANRAAQPPPPPPQQEAYNAAPGQPIAQPYPVQQGVPMQAGPAVVVQQPPKDDYNIACMGTVCCGGIGCLATMCCCNSPTGRYGSATGCVAHSIANLVVGIVFLILVLSKAVACHSDLHPPTNPVFCRGMWMIGNSSCMLEDGCPSGYKQVGASRTAEAYCKNDDWHSCLNVRSLPAEIIELVIFTIAACVAVYYRKIYKKQLDQYNANPTAYTPMVNFAQPAYAQPYPQVQPYPGHVQAYPMQAQPYPVQPHQAQPYSAPVQPMQNQQV